MLYRMNGLFNRTFFRFTLGFVSILIASFALAAVVAHYDNKEDLRATVPRTD